MNSTRDIIKFLQNELLQHFNEAAKSNDFEKVTIDFSVEVDGKIKIKESSLINKKQQEKRINIYEIEEVFKGLNYHLFYQVALSNSSFYFDYKRSTIFLKDNIESILLNIKSIAKNIIKDKWKADVKVEEINYSAGEKENGEVEVISVNSKNQYGVVIRVQLIDIANVIFKIDF